MVDLREIGKKRIVYTLPGMEAVTPRKDLTYKSIDGTYLKMDIYYPVNLQSKSSYPAVIPVHGDGPAGLLRNAKEWGVSVSFGQLLATPPSLTMRQAITASTSSMMTSVRVRSSDKRSISS